MREGEIYMMVVLAILQRFEGGRDICDGGSGYFTEVFVALLNFCLVKHSLSSVMAHCASG